MLNDDKIVCIGGANIDIKAKGTSSLVLKSSNPVKSFASFGGVARNIAENLSLLGVSVSLVSRLGRDPWGASILRDLERLRIDCSAVNQSDSFPTATYTALLEPQGEMCIAIADMDIYEEMTPEVLGAHRGLISGAKFLILDTNLSEKSLLSVAQMASSHAQVWAVPVSVSKVARLRNLLSDLDGIVLNAQELSELCGKDAYDLPIQKEVCNSLLEKGLSAVIVTRGEEGVFLATPEKCVSFHVKKKTISADVTGAGDSLAAGVFKGLLQGLDLSESVQLGIAAAQLNLQSEGTVNPGLSWDKLGAEIQSLSCEMREVV